MTSQITTLLNHYKNPLIVDVETTIHLNGYPFSNKNELVMIALGDGEWYQTYTRDKFHEAKKILQTSELWITFNGKFDIHWLRRTLGLVPKTVWECQIAEFLFSNQLWSYPSLNEACVKRGLPEKLDVVKTEYWDKGIDTTEIPTDILQKYALQDVASTFALFEAQCADFGGPQASKFKLFRAQCNDLLVLQEMEWNGILYDVENSLKEAQAIQDKITNIDSQLNAYAEIKLSFDSRQDVSKFFYGGVKVESYYAPIGEYKTGPRKGEVKLKKFEKEHTLPRLFEPLPGTEKVADGIYSTDWDTIQKLKTSKTTKKILTLYSERVKLDKLNTTYLTGIPKVIAKYDCDVDNIIHSNFNQCVVVSGRLSSTKPNIQNQPGNAKTHCISRYST